MSIEDLRSWIHETPMSLCNAGADTCPDWDLTMAIYHLTNDIELSDRDQRALDRVKESHEDD